MERERKRERERGRGREGGWEGELFFHVASIIDILYYLENSNL